MINGKITISDLQYRALVEASVRLELLRDFLKNEDYICTDDIRSLLDIKKEVSENE